MPLTEDQREALRLELLARANERDRWISDRDQAAELARLQEFAAKRGFKEGWAERVYRAKFGEVPPGYEEIAA